MANDTFIPQHLSNSDAHFTPPHVVEATSTTLGGEIDLDPASCASANTVVRAKRYYTVADDGLVQPWSGRVFVNPPGGKVGGKSQAGLFFAKAVTMWLAGRVDAVVFLGFSLEILRLSQADASLPSALRFPICVPRERLAFLTDVGGTLVPQTSPTNANAVLFMPKTGQVDELAAFERAFARIGDVIIPTRLATRAEAVAS